MAQPFKIRFEVDGEVQFNRQLRSLQDDVKDFRPAFELIYAEFLETESKQFGAEGGFEGNERWKRLSEDYEKWKSRHFPGKPILELRGHLKRSLTQKGADGAVYRATEKELEMGTSIGYAIWHQRGTARMPARKPIELSEAQKKRWVAIMHKTFKDKIDRSASQRYKPKTKS